MQTETTKETFQAALDRFITTVSEYRRQTHIKKSGNHTVEPGGVFYNDHLLTVDPNGKKYLRINGGRSVYCFIEIATGNVLKAEGWKKPAKGIRGSIYANDFAGYGVTEYGARYAR